MSELVRGLAMAACALVGGGAERTARAATPPVSGDWTVDTSWLSYVETDDRVAVAKSMGNLSRRLDDGSVTVSLVHDTMSGASPTGAIRSDDAAVTYTGASGGGGFAAVGGADGSRGAFEDTRVQAGIGVERETSRTLTASFGGVVSRESDYESIGADVGISRSRTDRLGSVDAGLAFTVDSIHRADGGHTPEPLGEVGRARRFEPGQRRTVETRVGVSRVLNRRTVAELGATLGLSQGYHSDPYKVVSVADVEDRLIVDLHDSRPTSRLRTSLQGRLVHQLADSVDSLHLTYRLYRDDWGILSNTLDARYRHALTREQYLEPHVRLYRQGKADFLVRKIDIDDTLAPVLPEDGFASADYRLDAMRTVTIGIKYGIALGERTDFRVRAEIVDQRFETVDEDRNRATVLQTSLRHRF